MLRKGQSSVEYIMVIGLALILASPFLISSQSSIVQLNEASNYLMLDNSLDKLESTSNTLDDKSYPARRIVRFSTPRGVSSVYNPQLGNRSALIFETELTGKTSNRSRIFDYNLYLSEDSNLSREGLHKLSVKKYSSNITVSVVS